MKIQINKDEIRIFGERGVDVRISIHSDKDLDRFIFSLCYDGFDHGCLPMIEVSGNKNIIVSNNMKMGRYLLNGRD